MRNEGQIAHCKGVISHHKKEISYNTIKLAILEMKHPLEKKDIKEMIDDFHQEFEDITSREMLLSYLHTYGIKTESDGENS